jgi:hypothetical protein
MKAKASNIMNAKAVIMTVIILAGCLFTACQPTPEDAVVTNKGDINLEESIQKTAALPEAATQEAKETAKKWAYEKEYDSGNRLIIDAVMVHTDADKLPVLSVAPKMFGSGNQLKTITDIFVPNATIYDQGDQLTKSQLERSIMDVKEQIFRVENDMIPHEGASEPIPEDGKEGYLSGLHAAIDYYEEEMKTAPDDSELKKASYQLVDYGVDGQQSNMLATANDAVFSIDFVNRPPDRIGSGFYFESNKFKYENTNTFAKFVIPESLEDDSEYRKAKERIDQCVKNMSIDYMSLSMACKGEDSYSFYYTRDFNGLQETYVNDHKGTSAVGVDFAEVIYLWKPEYLWFEVQNDQIVKVTWNNPSEIINVDNENVQVKTWEEIQEIFKKQMDFLMSPTPTKSDDPSKATYFFEKTDVYINRVELGLTKLLMKDSQDDYKLIPTWSFLGYQTIASYPAQEGVNVGGEVCYLTINAIDGTVIDRGPMY